MTSRDFVYWLQGFIEITKPETINAEQTKVIQNHLNLVFRHEIDPSMGDKEHQNILNQIHSGNILGGPVYPNENDVVMRC